MREIKFRAWIISQNKWYGEDIKWFPLRSLYNEDNCSKDLIFCQFTNLRDKNGKEVYEGDIISGEDEIHWKIVFRQAAYFAYSESTLIDIDDRWTELNIFDLNYFEVIGNIYENPELLES
jgi:hypothetical protein